MPLPASDWSLIRETPTLLGVVKPAGLLSVPGRGPSKADCLIARVQRRFPEARIVHRLDQATSGVMVLARTADAHRALGWQFERREVSKRYVAIVAGHVEQDEGEIDAPLRKALADGPRHVVDPVHGKAAVTRWRVVERTTLGAVRGAARSRGLRPESIVMPEADDSMLVTRLDLVPFTGRSHQLRVHLAHASHAVVGDEFYAAPEVHALAPRLLLHAEELVVRDPGEAGVEVRLESAAEW
jgi:tRNA pseudouridine32 synthase/23S rRNA pseudouridine746 synthase